MVPIVADEARTFGMQTLFRQVGIYSALGQLYEPEDHDELLYYREAKDGQILEEGITEAGALSSWLAAATAYSSHGTPMLPFYIYYSMFGFQRVGDLDLGGGRLARARLPGRRHRRAHHARRRGPAAPGRLLASHRVDDPELPRLRPLLRLRARRHRRGWRAAACSRRRRTSSFT